MVSTSFGRFLRAQRGVTAIEFALVAPVFLMLLFGTLESSMAYFVATTMEGEVQRAARQIRTGAVQAADDPLETFRTALCNNLENLTDCSRVVIDVRTFPDFGDLDRPPLIDDDGNPQNESFDPGGAGEVVLVRIAYRYDIMTPFLSDVMSDGNGYYDIYAAAAFQNEPYEGTID